MGNEVEMDEKYTPYNHKGTKIDGVESKHRGTPASKRGLSYHHCNSEIWAYNCQNIKLRQAIISRSIKIW